MVVFFRSGQLVYFN